MCIVSTSSHLHCFQFFLSLNYTLIREEQKVWLYLCPFKVTIPIDFLFYFFSSFRNFFGFSFSNLFNATCCSCKTAKKNGNIISISRAQSKILLYKLQFYYCPYHKVALLSTSYIAQFWFVLVYFPAPIHFFFLTQVQIYSN